MSAATSWALLMVKFYSTPPARIDPGSSGVAGVVGIVAQHNLIVASGFAGHAYCTPVYWLHFLMAIDRGATSN